MNSLSPGVLCSTKGMRGASIGRRRKQRMSSSQRMGSGNMRNGIWGSTGRSTRIPRDGMNSLMVILKTSICGVLTAESRAGQYKHFDIENAAAHLHGMVDAKHGEHGSANDTAMK